MNSEPQEVAKQLLQSLTYGIEYDVSPHLRVSDNLRTPEETKIHASESLSEIHQAKPLTKTESIVVPDHHLIDELRAIDQKVQQCQLCGLCLTRTNAVPGMGSYQPLVMVIGEAPGADEDRQGLPFVGKAGQYLDEWLKALGLSRQETVYITNIVKCRPPGNRDPHPEEIKSCSPYVEKQIDLIEPKSILSLGRFSAAFLLGSAHRMEDIHGKMFEYRGVPVFPTYHPSAVLRNQDLRRPVWEDLKNLHQFLYVQGLVTELPQKKKAD